MAQKKMLTLNEALDYLDNLEDSFSESEFESDVADDDFQSAKIFIQPPINANNENSDIDSGDENEPTGDASLLSGNQLLASAVVDIKCPSGRVITPNDEELSSAIEPKTVVNAAKRRKPNMQQHVNNWSHSDMADNSQFQWKFSAPNLDSSESPVTLFEKFFTNDILEHISNESVRYSKQKGNHNFNVDVDTMKSFISILLISGYVDLPRRPMYWENAADVQNYAVSSLMSRNQFDEIMQNLHLADNSSLDTNDKFSKVRPLLDKLNEQCLLQYIPEQTISVDESMVPYFGRHGCKQFMRNKPVKFGYKFWVAATPLGYAIQFYPYMGKDEYYDPNMGLGGSVVTKLVDSLPKVDGSNYHIVIDNFFTSPRLLRSLKEKGIAATGTVRVNRTENAPLKSVKEMDKLVRGSSEVVTETNTNLTFVRWKDNKVVTVASTLFGKRPIKKAQRYVKAKNGRVEIEQPHSIYQYNQGMGGVDRLDQNISVYMISHRSKKWWWPIFRFCLDLSVNNAFQLYRHQQKSAGEKKLDFLGFRRAIVDTYYHRYRRSAPTGIFPAPRKLVKVSPDVRYDNDGHWIGKAKQRRCGNCSKTTLYFCEKCNVALHPECFKSFHQK